MESENTNELYVEKKYFYFTVFLVLLFVAASIMTCLFVFDSKLENITAPKNETGVLPVINVTENEKSYEVKEYNGRIGVFEDNSLLYTVDVYVFTLPKSDQKLLSDGIKADSKEELNEILEEYY